MSAEKVELEQVPLKSDTDAPAESETPAEMTTDVDADAEAEKPVVEQKKRGLFHFFAKSSAKKVENVEGEEAEGEAEAKPEAEEEKKDAAEAPKKEQRKWWQRANCGNKQKKAEGEAEAQPQFGFDMINRDEHNINEHVALNFEDIFGEPDAVHSLDCVWTSTNKVFKGCRLFFYRLFSLIVAIPAAILFALLFAVVQVFSVFCCTPAGRLLAVPALWIAKTWAFLVHAIFDPIFKSIANICGKKNFAGFSSAPTSDNIA